VGTVTFKLSYSKYCGITKNWRRQLLSPILCTFVKDVFIDSNKYIIINSSSLNYICIITGKLHIPWNNISLQNFRNNIGYPVLISSLGLLVMHCAIGTVNEKKMVVERAATVSATARAHETPDSMTRYKNSSIHVACRSFYWKLFYIIHFSRQFHWNRPVVLNIYVTALLMAYKRYFFHREGISIELFLVTYLLKNKLQQYFVHFSQFHNKCTKPINNKRKHLTFGEQYPWTLSLSPPLSLSCSHLLKNPLTKNSSSTDCHSSTAIQISRFNVAIRELAILATILRIFPLPSEILRVVLQIRTPTLPLISMSIN
jgi:hypothetical protein